MALFPVLTVRLSGPVPERTLIRIARELQDRVEALPGVLEADIGGGREALLEVSVDDRRRERRATGPTFSWWAMPCSW